MKKSFSLILGVALILIGTVLGWWVMNRPCLPCELLSRGEAQDIVLEILREDSNFGSLAYLYPEVLKPGDKVISWDEDSNEKEMDDYTWLAWVDREPGNIFYAHPTQFVYINARSGEYEFEDQEFWPVVNGESFEGDLEDMISTGELAKIHRDFSFKKYGTEDIKKLLGIEAKAQQVGKYMRIIEKEENAPDGEYYAVIVAGFGKNAWVFLEGAHLMYDALINLGYSEDHIMFLAPYRARLPENWDRTNLARPPLEGSDRVDERTSPTNLSSVLKGFQDSLTKRDSLFIFMLAHGKKGRFALGEPVGGRQKMGVHDLRRGSSASYSSNRFADMSVERIEACELMILIDSCYAGTHESSLRAGYDPEKIKRMQVAHSARDTISFGADYRKPVSGTPVLADLDNGAQNTQTKDPNPSDRGGEFSSGFISNMGSGIFSLSYNSGVQLDAARLNKLTDPFIWGLGEDGPCVQQQEPLTEEPEDQPQTPEGQPQDEPQSDPEPEPEEEPERKTISAITYQDTYIPFAQLRAFSPEGCECCDEAHYHARNGVSVTTTDGQVVQDPFTDCGFGKVSEKPVLQVEADQ
ncbi:MAG: hypothetical protein GF370_03405 [Candidatus Nealsonbacteria bacterium]|nr:hypothetical protein [Candidatus Nealsonbacteria bacterium]